MFPVIGKDLHSLLVLGIRLIALRLMIWIARYNSDRHYHLSSESILMQQLLKNIFRI